MAASFQPKFVDLVRNYTSTVGTDDFVLGPVVNGYAGFATALQVGDSFYYSAIGVDKPAETEVGRGTLGATGTISRDPIGGVRTNFSSGTKAVALIAAAEWYEQIGAAAVATAQAPTSAADRSALAELTQIAVPALLTEGDRGGLFIWNGSDLSADVAADPQQGIFVAPVSDPSGASGAWVRKHSGAKDVRWFGAKGDGTTDDTAAIQAALDYLNSIDGGTVSFPAGTYVVSAYLTVFPKTTIRGAGRRASTIACSHVGGGGASAHEDLLNGSVFATINPVNTNTRVNLDIRHIGIRNTDASNVGAAFYGRGGSFINLRDVYIDGFKYGVVLDQSEVVHIENCEIELQNGGGGCIWLVGTADLNAGASVGYTNQITVSRCQLSSFPGVSYLIIDDGGNSHSFVDNNYNGGISCIRGSGYAGLVVSGGEFEGASGPLIDLHSATLAGTGIGCSDLTIDGGIFVPSGQNAAIKGNDSPGNLSVRGGFYNGAAIPLQGGANFASLSIEAPNVNNDSRAPFSDGQAGFGYFDSRFYRVAPDGTSYSSGPQSGGSGLNYFLDNDNGASTIWARSWNGGVQFDGYLQWARNAYVALNHTLGGTLRAADADVAVWDSAGLKVRLGALGYASGRGGTVIQANSKSAGVTLNKICGQVTMDAEALGAGASVAFVVGNSTVESTDTVIVNLASGGTANAYRAAVTAVAVGSFTVTVENITAGTLSEAPVISFAVLKAVAA